MRRKAAQAVHRSLSPTPGPVQINAPARKPLEPAPIDSAAVTALRAEPARPGVYRVTRRTAE